LIIMIPLTSSGRAHVSAIDFALTNLGHSRSFFFARSIPFAYGGPSLHLHAALLGGEVIPVCPTSVRGRALLFLCRRFSPALAHSPTKMRS
jgi:hypothetical protein